MIRLGPSGIGGVKDAVNRLEEYKKAGLSAAEIEFTYGVYIKSNKDASRIGKEAKRFGIMLSIHAPYYVNLASYDKKKLSASKKRILRCCEKGHYLRARYIVFHPAFYGKRGAEETYDMVKKAILEMQRVIKKKKWNVQLAPETTGKRSQFGSLDELLKLRKEIGCALCVDFAHLLAREGKINYNEIFKKLKPLKHVHSHFSGIEFTAKGERRHLLTPVSKIKEMLKYTKKYKVDITIINESPDPVGDCVKTLKLLK